MIPSCDSACPISALSALSVPAGLVHDVADDGTVANANVLQLRCNETENEYIDPMSAEGDYIFRWGLRVQYAGVKKIPKMIMSKLLSMSYPNPNLPMFFTK